MKNNKILFIDTETGGLDPTTNSLLSVAFVVWENGEFLLSKEVLINDGILNVSPQALEINKINIAKHSKNALKSEFAVLEIESFLNENFNNDEKIILCGHNIIFDINFFKAFWTKNGRNYNQRFSHRYIDTASLLFYLSIANKIPSELTSSDKAFDYFKISVNKRHSALGDVIATAELFNKLVHIIS